MPSARKQIIVRPNDGQDAPWRAAASREGISLNEWITRTLDGAVELVLGESRKITPRQAPEPPPPARVPVGFASPPAVKIPKAAEPLEVPKAGEPQIPQAGEPRRTTSARWHRKLHRPAIECPSREFVDGICPTCGSPGPPE